VILPIVLIIIALTGSTMNFVASISNSTTARNAINLIVPPTTDNTNQSLSNQTNDFNFVEFIRGGKNATFHLLERLLMQRDAVTEVLQVFGGKALSVLSTVAGVTAQFIIGLLIFLVSTYTFLLHGNELWTWTIHHSPLSSKHMNRFFHAFHETGRGLLIGVCLTCAVQGFVAAIAYLCLQIPRWYALGVLTGLCSLIPILGTAIVWIPITIGLFIQQSYLKAVIMITVGVLAIGSIDNLLRPVFSKLGSLQMSTLLLLLTIFGGLELLGPWGALLGPLIVRLATEAIILVREDEDEESNYSRT
jgi:predicted PurR-regulated permease PerM